MFHNEQMVIGIATGLALSATLRWAPSGRELLTAAVAAVLIDLASSGQVRQALERAFGAAQPAEEITVYPHLCPCLALAFIGVLAVLHIGWKR